MNDITRDLQRPALPAAQAAAVSRSAGGWPAFFALVRGYWRVILGTAAVCAVVMAVFALLATIYYRAEVIVTAVRPEAQGGAMALASDIAGAMGVNLLQQNADVETANAILTSRHLIQEFITRNGLLPLLNKPGKKPLTLWFAVRRFREDIVTIHPDTKKGVTVVSVEWTDPVTAARWANGFVALANELMRTRALEESKRNINYLNGQLTQTSEVEVRHSIYNLIESETKKAMLANGKLEYSFQVVDPAVTPEIRDRPKRTLMVSVATVLGLLAGIGIAYFLDVRRRERLAVAGA
jgi:uncharacterized protein involved in exopolysaccharide biosynthesis